MSASIARICRGRLARRSWPSMSTKRSKARSSRARIALLSLRPYDIAIDLESRPVVPFDHAGDLRRHRVRAEIGGEIHDADAVVAIALAAPQRLGRRLEPVATSGCARTARCRCSDSETARNASGVTIRRPSRTPCTTSATKTRLVAPIARRLLRVQQHALARKDDRA